MKGLIRTIILAAGACACPAFATPSTQIWIPSTDIQAAGKFHYGLDIYAPMEKSAGGWTAPTVVQGLTVGLPLAGKVGIEFGADLKAVGADANPVYWNAKIGAPEGALFPGSPALALGGYDFGQTDATGYDIMYGLAAMTFGGFGRFSAGYFTGDRSLLGEGENAGLLLSWDRTLKEVSPKLWAAVDFQEGKSGYGAVNFGLSWAFSDNVSVIYGWDLYNNPALPAGYTVQLDVNF